MMRRRHLVPLAAALGVPRPSRAEVTGADVFGRTIRLAGPARRIVSLHGAAEAQLAALGIRPVGTNLIHRGYVANMTWLLGADRTPSGVVNADWTADLERILALDPDLVIAWSDEHVRTIGRHLPVFVMRPLTSIGDLRGNLRALGALVGRAAEASRVIAAFDRRLRAYGLAARRDISALAVSITGNRHFWLFPSRDALSEILGRISDASRLAAIPRFGWLDGGMETLHRLDPDAIVLVQWHTAPDHDVRAMLAKDRLWRALRAVREGRVIPVNGFEAVTFHSIPTAARLLDTVAPHLYPDIFPTALDEDRIAAILGG